MPNIYIFIYRNKNVQRLRKAQLVSIEKLKT